MQKVLKSAAFISVCLCQELEAQPTTDVLKQPTPITDEVEVVYAEENTDYFEPENDKNETVEPKSETATETTREEEICTDETGPEGE